MKFFLSLFIFIIVSVSLPIVAFANTGVDAYKVACPEANENGVYPPCDSDESGGGVTCFLSVAYSSPVAAGTEITFIGSATKSGGTDARCGGGGEGTPGPQDNVISVGSFPNSVGSTHQQGPIGTIRIPTAPAIPGPYRAGFAAQFVPFAWGQPGYFFPNFSYTGTAIAAITVTGPAPTLQLNGRAAFLRVLFTPVFAQQPTDPQSALIADVEIPQVSVTQVDRLISATFTLRADIAQTGIRYGLTLSKEGTANSYTDVHQEVANDTITLGQNESKSVQASFTIPQSVPADTYAAFITSYTNKGVILASKYAGEVTLVSVTPVATIACTQPVDANADKTVCIIKNTTKVVQTLSFYTITRSGSTLFGSDTGTPVKQVITLKPLQSQTITLPLTPNVSQTLLNYITTSDDKTIIARDTITTRAFPKPSLDNVFMVATDKDITVSAITRRTNTTNTGNITLTLEDNNGTVCGAAPSTLTTGIRTDITLTPTCDAGTALVTLTDTNNQILDQSRIPFALDASKASVQPQSPAVPWWVWVVGVVVLIFLLVRLNRNRVSI